MIKPAATLSKSRHITVLGTPLTMASCRYSHLKATHASGLRVDEPDASGWAAHIEHDNADHISFEALSQSVADGSDVIVLACTHYITLKDKLESLYSDVTVLEPTEAIARQISLLRDVHGL
jgi:glutamate racemase